MDLIDVMAATNVRETVPWITTDYLFQAKHFVLDTEASVRVYQMNRQRELLAELREFAIPPFEKMTFEMQTFHQGSDGVRTMTQSLFCVDGASRAWFYEQDGGLWVQAADHVRVSDGLTLDPVSLFNARDLTDCFILLLLAKRTTTTVEHSKRTGLRKGKRVQYYARSEITIQLDPLPGIKKAVSDGSRAPYRRHEVHGHFVHRGGDKHCVHAWEPVQWPDGKQRWECTSCGRKRTWKKAYERGDASRGWVRSKYKVIG